MKIVQKSVLVLVALAAFGMMAGCDKAERAMDKADLGAISEITKLIGSTTDALAGIEDLDSAKAALPALKNVDLELGKLVQKFGDMSPEQKSELTGVVSKAMPQMESAIRKVSGMPGVGAVVRPTLDSLKNKFKSMI